MKQDLRSMKGSGNAGSSSGGNTGNTGGRTQEGFSAEDIFNQYKGKSEGEIKSELERMIAAGGYDLSALNEMLKRTAPMLSEEQRAKMTALLSRLK